MSKHTSKELQRMAKLLLVSKRTLDCRYLEFVLMMSLKTQTSVEHVETQIVKYANGDFDEL
jgi:hypothetical protein